MFQHEKLLLICSCMAPNVQRQRQKAEGLEENERNWSSSWVREEVCPRCHTRSCCLLSQQTSTVELVHQLLVAKRHRLKNHFSDQRERKVHFALCLNAAFSLSWTETEHKLSGIYTTELYSLYALPTQPINGINLKLQSTFLALQCEWLLCWMLHFKGAIVFVQFNCKPGKVQTTTNKIFTALKKKKKCHTQQNTVR